MSPDSRSRSRSRSAEGATRKNALDSVNFDAPIDRSDIHTVKHGLAEVIYGPQASGCLPLWVADMDLQVCPHIQQAIQSRAAHATFGYTYQPSEIWTLIVNWYRSHHSWEVPVDRFVFSACVVTSVSNLLEAFTRPGDAVMVMTPLYAPLQAVISKGGRQLVCHQLQSPHYGMDLERLTAALPSVKCLLLCNPHNPSGRVWSREELTQLAEACHRHGVLLISDEIWSDWTLWGREYVPVATVAPAGLRVVTLGAPTKTWNLAGLHCSFLVFSDLGLKDKYLAKVEHAFLHYGSTFATVAMLAAYEHGGGWLDKAKSYVQHNLKFVEEFISANLPEIRPLLPEATYLIWLDCRGLGLQNSAALNKFMIENARILLSDGEQFGGEAGQFQRVNCACRRSLLVEAMQRLLDAVKKLRCQRLP